MKIFVMIPTYNERENIKSLIRQIFNLKIKNLHIAVVDDNSPDGTWKIVREISKKNMHIHLLRRMNYRGRGYAGRDGFIYCIKHGADVVIEMDADMSHNPKYIPLMIKELRNADLVLGSRMIKGGEQIGRSFIRQIITNLANFYVRVMLGLSVKDGNSGFRCFKRKVLEGINPERLESKGPSIVQEVLFKAHLKGFKIKEVPITFVDRTKGISKLGFAQLTAGYFMVLKLKFKKLLN